MELDRHIRWVRPLAIVLIVVAAAWWMAAPLALRAGPPACAQVAPDADHQTMQDGATLAGAQYHAGRWTRDRQTIGYSAAEDSIVWNHPRCTRSGKQRSN